MQVSKEKFIEMYMTMTIKEMVEKLGFSRISIKRWANKFDLPHKMPRKQQPKSLIK